MTTPSQPPTTPAENSPSFNPWSALSSTLTIGLTGGIGSGKSTVGHMLVALGAILIDTDAIAHGLTGPQGAAMQAIRQTFGDDAITPQGALHRPWMRQRMLEEPTVKQQLEGLLHPLITQTALEQALQAQQQGLAQAIVFDVPLLAERPHWRARVHKVLVVDCDELTQIRRVQARSGWSESQIRQIMAQQAAREERRVIADAVILNDDLSISALEQQVASIWQRWQSEWASRL